MSKQTKLVGLCFLFILAFAVFVSFYCFRTHPDFWFDESIYYQLVNNLASHGKLGISLSPTLTSDISMIAMGYPVFLPAAAVFKIFGAGVIIIRIVAISFLLGSVIVFFFLSKKWYGTRIALLATALFVMFSPLYGDGKSFLGEVPGLFYFMLGLIFLFEAERKNYVLGKLFFAGIFLGLAISAKPIYILIAPALAVSCLIHWRVFFTTKHGWRTVGILAIAVCIPVVIWVVTQFGSTVTSLARIFTHYSNPYYVTNLAPLVFINLKRFITESTPIHFLILYVLAIWYFISQFRLRRSITNSEITAFAFISFVLFFYFRTIGWYRNFFPAHAMLFLFTIPGVYAVVASLIRDKFWINRISVAIILLLLFAEIIPLTENALYCKIDASTAVSPYLQTLDKNKPVLFYSLPQLAARYQGPLSYQYIKMSDRFQLGQENLALINIDFFDVIFIESGQQDKMSQYKNYYLEKNIYDISIYHKISK